MANGHGMTRDEIEAHQARWGKGPHLAADLVVLTARWNGSDPDLRVLLIQRKSNPYGGSWALPGGFVDMNEDLEDAARRELAEETGITDLGSSHVEALRAFGRPDRDPRSRVVSAVHLAWVPWRELAEPTAGDDAAAATFIAIRRGVAVDETGDPLKLAFDHDRVLAEAWARIQLHARWASTPLAIAPLTFDTAQLAALYRCLLGAVDPDALIEFHQANGWIERVDQTTWRAHGQVRWATPRWLCSPNST